jgi:hypothetical protein
MPALHANGQSSRCVTGSDELGERRYASAFAGGTVCGNLVLLLEQAD